MHDNELIYQYQVEKQHVAFLFLWNKYFSLIEKITIFIYKKFSSIPLELGDFISIQYFSFFESVSTYKESANKSFYSYMQQRLKWDLLQYIKKYINKNHAIINYAVNYNKIEDWLKIDSVNQPVYFVNESKWSNYGLPFLTKLENEVISLKFQSYSNEEICERLKISYRTVDNAYQRAKSKLRKNKEQ